MKQSFQRRHKRLRDLVSSAVESPSVKRGSAFVERAVLRYRKILAILIQLGLMVGAYVFAFILRLDLDVGAVPWGLVLKTLPLLIAVRVVSLAMFQLYQGLWRYVSVVDLVQIAKATTYGSAMFAALEITIFGLDDFPRSVFFIDWAGNIFLLSGIRLAMRLLRERFRPTGRESRSFQRMLIIGAGDAGAELCKQALGSPIFRFKPVAFVDDDPQKVGGTILGVPIVAPCADLGKVITEYEVDMAIIAIPSATPAEKRTLVELCQQAGVPIKIIPTVPDLLDSPVRLSRLREVDPADLLGRPPAQLDRNAVRRFVGGKTILVTGAAGSVGSELARQLAGLEPGLLVLIDHAENPLMFLEVELRENFPGTRLVAQIADISHDLEIQRIMACHRPQVLFQAAAHKHVNLMERAPGEAVLNNVGGTFVLARNAMEAGIETFVLVSTDKAIKPTSVMGATKRLAEMLLQELDGTGPTRFISVRFGNVLGSNGSVVPIFKQQIARGGPVTVTHPEADRYFMSISEAAGLILQAGAVGNGGETFVLDMGEPVRIVDLAETLIALVGLKPHEDVEIVYTGLRPGEKLSEELLADDEDFLSTGYEKLLKLKTTSSSGFLAATVGEFLDVLPTLDTEQARSRLGRLVPEYRPSTLADTYLPAPEALSRHIESRGTLRE